MPPQVSSDNAPQSQSQSQQSQSQTQLRPNLAARHRSTSSITSHQTDSPAGTPPTSGTTATQHKEHKVKGERKHLVGKYGRVSSNKALHKLSRQTSTHNNNHHNHTTSNDNLKQFEAPWDRPHNSSTNLNRQKNHSQTALKRNRSSADVQHTPGSTRRPKSSDGKKRPNSVHFELGIGTPGKVEVEEDNEEGWEEASSNASPALSRSANTSGKPSAVNSAVSSRHHSPLSSPKSKKTFARESVRDFAKESSADNFDGNGNVKKSTTKDRDSDSSADAKVITEKLLQRTPSHMASETRMSMATAKPTPKVAHTPSSSMDRASTMVKSMGASTASGNQELISRFVGDAGTPGENSPKFPPPDHGRESRTSAANRGGAEKNANGGNGEMARAKSMGSLTRHDVDDEEESALLPRSRKGSTSGNSGPPNAYNSRTQQKLWLQRASSNIEPQREGLGALSLLNGGIGMGNHGGGSSVGYGPGMGMGIGGGMGGYPMGGDGKGDPRIKLQLERTGLEYLVVRRHQDPVGRGVKRLEKMGVLGHGGKNIHGNGYAHSKGSSANVSRAGSLRERNGNARKGAGQSFEGEDRERGSDTDRDGGGSGLDEENVATLLRSLWEKSFEGSGSAD
ncbi:predicted protein [Sclerotinia sclerotiorum 1980 UF-70]|uniref:TORC1 subunit TCO89 domain-containing protein n=2 Tax=Sclerotinia sclerotiorum (strain ATCC 18683 / 1980 / Ss-1) TaxID=665079 RepID=A7EAF0_SCLS1|nr:predicted protein [Sclerotinia sclerotiorum 1980 UF-70]APA08570.1 hypothetical protein sscle_04g033400 [Sclerotinia sclerotiorum 1980 UF-70]EDN99428.1 predicted protein [Sclerotinia sclerotiorum 1980 UF-70]